MSVIIKLQGLPLEANSIDVRLYFLGLTIPDGGVHIVGGEEGLVFIEFASDEDARQAMARGPGIIKNSNIRLLLSSRNEMQSVIDNLRLVQPWFNPQPPAPLLPWMQVPSTQPASLIDQQQYSNNTSINSSGQRPRGMSGMRGGDDKLFFDKRCVLAASNIPYRATSKDIISFLEGFDIREECIRRRYNGKGQPTADAKIAFPTPDAALRALKQFNKKHLCGRPVFLKPV